MNKTIANMHNLLKTTPFNVDTIGSLIDRDNLDMMIIEAEKLKLTLCDDYEVVTTPQVKEIMLEHYNTLNKNIRTLEFVKNHHIDVIPVLERCGQ